MTEETDAKARAKEQKAAVKAKADNITEYRDSVEKDAKNTQAVQDVEPRAAYGGASEEWGPFDEPQVVTTPYGDYGVAYRKVLFFAEVERFDKRINQMVKVMKDHRRDATKEEMEPVYARRAKKKAALAGRT